MIQLQRVCDSSFADIREIRITINTELDLTGFSGKFVFQGVDRNFSSEQLADHVVYVRYTTAEARSFALGKNYGVFHLYDANGRHAAIRKVVIEVVDAPTCECEDDITITIEYIYTYEKLIGLPKLNGVTIVGEMSSADLNLAGKSELEAETNRALVAESAIRTYADSTFVRQDILGDAQYTENLTVGQIAKSLGWKGQD